MYEISPKSLAEFVTDASIKLPRFQRKKTWDYKDRFELALSIFKNYPLGASILSRETLPDKTTCRYLLDGRQRRDTLIQIYENPDCLYDWGKKYLAINEKDSNAKIEENLWKKLADFIEDSELEQKLINGNKEDEEYGKNDYEIDNQVTIKTDEDTYLDENNIDENNFEPSCDLRKGDLDILLSLIEVAANYYKSGRTGITSLFDIKQYFELNKALINDLYTTDQKNIDCKKLRVFLRKYLLESGSEYNKVETYKSYLENKYDWKKNEDVKKAEFDVEISNNKWDAMCKIMDCFNRIDTIFVSRKIAIIETYNITSTDSQKIFNLINTGGTKLTASEILSAKPKWNKNVDTITNAMEVSINLLYDKLSFGYKQTKPFVKWDIPASLTYFLEGSMPEDSGLSLFFKIKQDDVAKRITLGFKLLSGFYGTGIKKEDINILENDTIFKWDNVIENLNELNNFFETLKNDPYLNVLKSWGKCLSDVISDAPTMNILFLLFRSWKELKGPTGFFGEAKKIFDKNVFILLDKAIFEYTNNIWKASSDGIITNRLKQFNSNNDRDHEGLFIPISVENWKNLIEELSTSNTINGKLIEKDDLSAIIYFYNIINSKKGKGSLYPAEIDHIIPQSAWKSAQGIAYKESIQNNYFNLALLPKDINASKKDHFLSDVISNVSISRLISEYEDVPLEDFSTYSYVSSYTKLKEYREQLFNNTFLTKRNDLLIG